MPSITIIEKKESYAVVRCIRCDGNGEVSATPVGSKECPACGGKGKLKLTKSPPFSKCTRCDGAGEVSATPVGTKECPGCEGIGIVSDDDLESY